jgi:hypothetical protein
MALESEEKTKAEILERLYKDRALAHEVLFPHRHKNKNPEFHKELMELLYCDHPWVGAKAFRGAAKSTKMEELIIINALFGDFKYALILGNSYDRACERLSAIKNEFTTNDAINELFGEQSGGTWAADQIVLANGCKIQSFGARQSLRGAKHNDNRPDFLFVDDLEDEENVATEDARRKLKRWFNGALIPALDPLGKIRMVGTPLHPKSLLETKMTDPAWKTDSFPIIYLDSSGEEVSAWPDRFPMEYINRLKQNYITDGNFVEFEQEFMCRSEDVAAKPFQANMIKVEPILAAWKPIQIVVDPARTVNATSARTGYAVFSWTGSKLEVHDAFGSFHRPDEIISTIFDLDDKFSPVEIGVEADGLEEFIMQPLRVEMLKRGQPIPLVKLKAPKNKDGFIRGLQPFYMAGDVIHAKNLPDLTSELLQFPTGRKDVPNALAYAPKMRVGKPVYEDFSISNISPMIESPDKRHPVYLALSARPASVAGVVVQYINGRVIIYKDWVKEGPAMEVLEGLVQDAVMFSNKEVLLVAPREQFNKYTNSGVQQAANRMRLEVRQGGEAAKSQGALAPWLRKSVQGTPALVVSDTARWTLNGFSRGYARKLNSAGILSDQPEENLYLLVMEAIESFVRWFDVANRSEGENSNLRYGTTAEGRRYLTSRGD